MTEATETPIQAEARRARARLRARMPAAEREAMDAEIRADPKAAFKRAADRFIANNPEHRRVYEDMLRIHADPNDVEVVIAGMRERARHGDHAAATAIEDARELAGRLRRKTAGT